MIQRTHYETLGVPPDTPVADIRAIYLRLAQKYHPDSDTGKQWPGRFAEITEAYSVLKDVKLRRAYDGTLALLARPCEHCGGKGRVRRTVGFTGRTWINCGECGGSGRQKPVN